MNTLTDNLELFGEGFKNTIILFFFSAIFALILGVIVGALRVSPVTPMRALGTFYVNVIRNTPLTLVFLFFFFGYPKLGFPNPGFVPLAIIALSLYTATYVSEAIRAGINTVPVGQAEASRAIGLPFGQTMSLVILPQAFRAVVPPMMSVFIELLKNTTVAAGFSVLEAGAIRSNLSERGYPAMQSLLWVALGFIILVAVLSLVQRKLENEVESRRCPMTTVLFDAPGIKAIRRNRVLGIITVVIVAAVLAFIIYKFAESGQFSAKKWSLFTFPLVQQNILQGLGSTLSAFGVAAVGSLILGMVLAVGRLSDRRWISVPVGWFTELFRAVPLLILMALMFYGLPSIGFQGMTPFIAVVVGLILYNGSVLAEVIRAGILAVPKGQSEAAYAIGLRKTRVMTMILLPQAVRTMLPVIIAQLVVALKDTALGFIITYQELLYKINYYGGQTSYETPIIPAAIIGGTLYVGCCLILAGLAKFAESRLRRSPKASNKNPPAVPGAGNLDMGNAGIGVS